MERRDHARIYIETAVSVGEMMNSAETAEALTHAIRPDGSAQMQSINRGLQRAIGPADDGFSGMRMPQPKLADGVRLGDAMKGRFAIIGTGDALSGIDSLSADMAVIIDSRDHPEVSMLLGDLGVAAFVVRPDFYCFGAVPENEGANAAALVAALADQLS